MLVNEDKIRKKSTPFQETVKAKENVRRDIHNKGLVYVCLFRVLRDVSLKFKFKRYLYWTSQETWH